MRLILIHRKHRRAFTLIEMLTSMSLILIVSILVGQAFQSVQHAIGSGTSNSQVLNDVRTLDAQLTDDFSRITKDGFLVIKFQDITETFDATSTAAPVIAPDGVTPLARKRAADQILFFATGPVTTAQLPSTGYGQTFQSDVARVWYGHLSSDNANEQAPSTIANPKPANGWIVGRHSLLLSPVIPTGLTYARNIWDQTTNPAPPTTPVITTSILSGLTDIANTDLTAIRNSINTATVPAGYPDTAGTWATTEDAAAHMSDACFRVYGKKTLTNTELATPANLAMIQSVLLANCSNFRIEYWDGTQFTRPDPTVTSSLSVGMGFGLGSFVIPGVTATTTVPIPGGGISSAVTLAPITGGSGITGPVYVNFVGGGGTGAAATATVAGGAITAITVTDVGTGYTTAPTVYLTSTPDAWPKAIRITATIHDSESRLRQDWLRVAQADLHNTPPDGKAYQFTIMLPQ